jgi:chromate transporter
MKPETITATFQEALKFWAKLGFISFGGPAGQIAIMHQEVVERRKWIGENQFLRALNFCMLLPGPEAQQLATYIGWRLHGTWGGIAAGSLFVIPSIFVILLLSYLAVAHIDIPAVAAAFYGIQPVVVAVVVEAVLRIGKKALKHRFLYGFAALAFVAIFAFKVPFPYVVAAAALGGLIMQRPMPEVFCKGQFDPQSRECRIEVESSTGNNTRPSIGHVARVFAVCLALWVIPMGVIWIWRGGSDTLTQIGDWSKQLPSGQRTVLYCVKGGSVSQSVTNRLRDEGLDAVFLNGGLKNWIESGQSVEAVRSLRKKYRPAVNLPTRCAPKKTSAACRKP